MVEKIGYIRELFRCRVGKLYPVGEVIVYSSKVEVKDRAW